MKKLARKVVLHRSAGIPEMLSWFHKRGGQACHGYKEAMHFVHLTHLLCLAGEGDTYGVEPIRTYLDSRVGLFTQAIQWARRVEIILHSPNQLVDIDVEVRFFRAGKMARFTARVRYSITTGECLHHESNGNPLSDRDADLAAINARATDSAHTDDL